MGVLATAGMCLLLLTGTPSGDGTASGENVYRRITRFVRSFEIEEQKAPPPWFPAGAPLFRFVQITDVHLNARHERLLAEACKFINEHVRPAFVVVTGDNAGTSSEAGQPESNSTGSWATGAGKYPPCFLPLIGMCSRS